MQKNRRIALARWIEVSALSALLLFSSTLGNSAVKLDALKFPSGFDVILYSGEVPGARSLAQGTNGTIFVGTRGDKVYAISDGETRKVHTIATGLNSPNGVAFRDGSLYVAEIHRILRFDHIEKRLSNPPKPVVVNDTFPKDKHHGWKFIRFSPDGWLYIPVGAPCNVCENEKDPRYASIMRMKPDGTSLEVYASGIRNTVGFDFHPQTKELWLTDNGRDRMGDDVPPDEINHAPKPGMHFGFPYCHGGTIVDPDFGSKYPCKRFTRPALNLGAHVAALGMRFYNGQRFPAEYRGNIFFAEHGSWNRSSKSGYRVMRAKMDAQGKLSAATPFIEGWKEKERVWGRPVDLEILPDGTMLVSDDEAGAIYQVVYKDR